MFTFEGHSTKHSILMETSFFVKCFPITFLLLSFYSFVNLLNDFFLSFYSHASLSFAFLFHWHPSSQPTPFLLLCLLLVYDLLSFRVLCLKNRVGSYAEKQRQHIFDYTTKKMTPTPISVNWQ